MKTSKTLIAVAIAALIPLGAAVAGDGAKDKAGTRSDLRQTRHEPRRQDFAG